ncbi:MAG TPA: hypothetical protein VIS27_09655 [Yeosuana sp.]
MLKSREINLDLITDIEVDGVDTRDYPDFCDGYIASATWSDTLEPLTDDELDDLNQSHGQFVYECIYDSVF